MTMRMHRLAKLLARLLGRGEPRNDDTPGLEKAPDVVLLRNAEEDDRTALRRILPYVFSDRRIEAFHAIATILESSPAEELPWIEELVRTSWRAAWHEPPFVQDLLEGHRTPAAGIMGVLSFHPSGYVRDAA